MDTAHLLWHASRTAIDRPTINGRVEGENHANSGLGIYCATKPMDYLCGFGQFIHELTIKPEARVLNMSIFDLGSMGRDEDRQWFEQEGRRLANEYDLIDLVEITGIAEQTIILRDDAIVSSVCLSSQEFSNIAIDHSQYQRQRRAGLGY